MSDIAWQELEEKIDLAARRLRDLAEENESLKEQVTALEQQLSGQTAESAGRWQREREEVGRRVDALVARLESLLGSSA